ncbi:MAG: hypothetical protein IKP95_09505 [Ruminococcus sp.]|nr:hypothetical protein [Ruminococcus sp.]
MSDAEKLKRRIQEFVKNDLAVFGKVSASTIAMAQAYGFKIKKNKVVKK